MSTTTEVVPNIVATTTASTTAGNDLDLVVTVPTGTANGALMLLAVYVVNSSDTVATPSGWTLTSGPNDVTGVRSYLFRRTASSEPASYTLDKTGANDIFRADIVTVAHGAFDAFGATGNTSSTTANVPAVTTGVNNCRVVLLDGFRAVSNNVATPASGYTELSDSGEAIKLNSQVAHAAAASAGVIASTTQTLAIAGASYCYRVSVKPL